MRRSSIDHSSATPTKKKFTIVFGTQSGTSEHVAKQLRSKMKETFKKCTDLSQDIKISVVAGDGTSPEKIVKRVNDSCVSLFVTCTFGNGEFPSSMQDFWKHLNTCKEGTLGSTKYSVLGLGSSMYADFMEELFNRAAKQLDLKLEELGGQRIEPIGLCDDLDRNNYRDGFEKWMAS